ncbi:MAG: hypothetical protein WBA93_00860 [Microcoleaceae cyanobacterium]
MNTDKQFLADLQIHQARKLPEKPVYSKHSSVTAELSTQAVSRNALKKIPKAPFQSLGIEFPQSGDLKLGLVGHKYLTEKQLQ